MNEHTHSDRLETFSDPPKWYKFVRTEIQREHAQINSRMGWFATQQAFLIVGLTHLQHATSGLNRTVVSFAIACAGGALAAYARQSVLAAMYKIQLLRAQEERLLAPAVTTGDWKMNAKTVGAWIAFITNDHHGIPAWFAKSSDDIDQHGVTYPQYAPCVFFWFWLLLAIYFLVSAAMGLVR